MNEKRNVVLIGMPGAGKSTIGVVLAKRLGYQFVDSDLVIQKQTGQLLSEIISDRGMEGFIQVENEVNANLQVQKSVVATGGSVIYGKEAMEHLKQLGKVLYLELPLEEIKERLGDLEERGVLMRQGQTLDTLYAERVPLYEKYADITVHCDKKQIREIVLEIQDLLNNTKS